jgi:hypothetical protein
VWTHCSAAVRCVRVFGTILPETIGVSHPSHLKTARNLPNAGASVNALNQRLSTPLHLAAWFGHEAVRPAQAGKRETAVKRKEDFR